MGQSIRENKNEEEYIGEGKYVQAKSIRLRGQDYGLQIQMLWSHPDTDPALNVRSDLLF